MTEAEYKAAHIALWQWLYENPSKEKWDWPGWGGNGGKYVHAPSLCFACAVSFSCGECVLRVSKSLVGCQPMLYKWEHAETPENRREYAGIMRDAWKEVEYD